MASIIDFMNHDVSMAGVYTPTEKIHAVLDEYNKYYFGKHPRAKKVPIDKPTIPSLNTWIILPRMQMNALKQKHKEFGIWWINKLGYQNMKLNEFEMDFYIYMPTKRRADNDNFVPKFNNSGLI